MTKAQRKLAVGCFLVFSAVAASAYPVSSEVMTSRYGVSASERQRSNYIEKNGYSFTYQGNGVWDVQLRRGVSATHKVVTNDGTALRLRNEPSFGGAQIGSLAYGSLVEVLERGNAVVDSDGNRGNWMRVISMNGAVGWCFGAYLRSL